MEEPHDESGKWMLIAHAVCCGGPLLLILIASNAASITEPGTQRGVLGRPGRAVRLMKEGEDL